MNLDRRGFLVGSLAATAAVSRREEPPPPRFPTPNSRACSAYRAN